MKSNNRVKVSIRLHKDTIRDLDKLSKKLDRIYKRPTRTTAIRYLLRMGFSSLGNWRNKGFRF